MEQIQEEIMQKLLEAVRTEKPSKFKDLKKYIGTQYNFIGLSTPGHRTIFKGGFSFNELTLDRQLEIWGHLWKNSHNYETMNFALSFISKHLSNFEPPYIWNIIKEWVAQVDNWAHSDGLSSLYAHLLEKEPELVYHQYMLWNISLNPWERRQSIVGLLYYSKQRKSILPFEKLLPMVNALIEDENYFVQKGVGWTLREMGNIYPQETLVYLDQQITLIRPVAFTAAIEKLDADNKERLKNLRKAGRKSPKNIK
jgi:3-methyladenine DNA glycosylase AlkD